MKLMYIQSHINEVINELYVQEGDVRVKDFKITKSNTVDNSYEVNILFMRKDSEEMYGAALYFD